jgi:predicted N-formylglutamate amidohydrolase
MKPARPDSNLLMSSDRAPVSVAGEPLSPGSLVLLGDHAGRTFPRAIGNMGLSDGDRNRHITLDLGIERLGRRLSEWLNAPFVSQVYSRLVVDCNRDPAAPGAMPEVSDGTTIPANVGLSAEQRDERVRAIHEPYHEAIAALLDSRAEAELPTILVALHSFTPVFGGERRVWDAGVLHGGPGDEYGKRVLALLQRQPDWVIGDNQPYAFDGTDYTIPRHAFARGLSWLELEVRQDLLSSPEQVEEVASRVAPLLLEAADRSSALGC